MLIKSIKENYFHMVYQPIVQSWNYKTVSLETLIRCDGEYWGTTSPESIIKQSEITSTYNSLSQYIMTTSLRECRRVLKKSADLCLSINVVDSDIINTFFIKELTNECLRNGINHEQVRLEISEKCSLDIDRIVHFSSALKQNGFSVSIDDFGIRNSNLNWIMQLEYDEIKIDKEIVHYLFDIHRKDVMISIIAGLQKTGKRIVFEGIETVEQLNVVQSIIPHAYIQGWHTGKPQKINMLDRISL